jgi:DNA gyrase inhibitor GyrI
MSELNVEIVTLNPMRVASAYGFGTNPEEQAWQKLAIWAKPRGLLDDKIEHPIFGFNNPNPTPGNAKYGYEFWVKVDSIAEPEEAIRILEFMGGTYAVVKCEAQGDPGKIPAAWQSLASWCKTNNHRFGRHQPLEKIISSPDDPVGLILELYCPIID